MTLLFFSADLSENVQARELPTSRPEPQTNSRGYQRRRVQARRTAWCFVASASCC